MPLGTPASKRALSNVKLQKVAKVVGSVAAVTENWQRGSRARATSRREILSKPAWERTDQELLLLEEILVRMKFVAQLSLDKRLDLCRVMGYLKTPAGTEIFRQGEVGTNFYVILQGSVNVLIKDTAGGEGCNVVATLYGGDSFGELALLQEGNQRAASITTRDASEFLTIGRDDYNMILRSVNEIQIIDKVTFMRELPLFKNVPYATVQSVAYVLTVRDYPRNAVVVRQGTECEDLFFVESGSVKLVREVEDRGLLRLNGVLALGPGALLQRDAGKGGAGMRVAARFKKGGINAEPPAPPGFREDEAEAPTSSSPDFYYTSSHRGPGSAGGGARAGERGGARHGAMPHINVGDAVPLGSYESAKDTSGSSDWAPLLHSSVDLQKRATTPGASPSLTSPPLRQRRYSGIDTGRLSPHRRDEAAAAAGLGRLFLEVGTHKRYDYFGDTVLTRKTKQAASVITTTSTRCYVLNKWDLLRRVDKSVIEHVQRDRGDQVEAMGNDRALIREFQRSREWMEYKDGLVEDIITRRMKNLGKR